MSGGFDVGARKAKEMAFFGHHLCYLCSLPTFVLFTYLFRSPLLPPSARPQVMVCTDRASRGVDFGGSSAPVGRVVLFDWPRDPAEFLRRVGRTARAGVAGACVALVVGKQVHAPSLEAAERRVLSAACRLPRAEAWECVCVCGGGVLAATRIQGSFYLPPSLTFQSPTACAPFLRCPFLPLLLSSGAPGARGGHGG